MIHCLGRVLNNVLPLHCEIYNLDFRPLALVGHTTQHSVLEIEFVALSLLQCAMNVVPACPCASPCICTATSSMR